MTDENVSPTPPTPPVPPSDPTPVTEESLREIEEANAAENALPEPDDEPTTGAPRTHSAADAQTLDVNDYRPEPGTATFKDDRTGEDVELSGEARSNEDLDTDNFAQEFPKRHVVSPTADFEPEEDLELDEVAKQVNEGKWGSGQDRRVLLDRYGYDPNEVQAASVRLLNQEKLEQDREQHEAI